MVKKIMVNGTRGLIVKRKLMEGFKINKPLSGLLVCRLIMSLAERLSSKFHICPRSLASRPNVHFSDSLSRGHYQPTYQPPEGVYLLNITCELIWKLIPPDATLNNQFCEKRTFRNDNLWEAKFNKTTILFVLVGYEIGFS